MSYDVSLLLHVCAVLPVYYLKILRLNQFLMTGMCCWSLPSMPEADIFTHWPRWPRLWWPQVFCKRDSMTRQPFLRTNCSFSTIRRFTDAGKAGIKRALAAGSKVHNDHRHHLYNIYLLLPLNQPFPRGLLWWCQGFYLASPLSRQSFFLNSKIKTPVFCFKNKVCLGWAGHLAWLPWRCLHHPWNEGNIEGEGCRSCWYEITS